MRPLAAACALLAVAGCKDIESARAVIVDPDEASRAALQATVSRLLGTNVLLADNALTETSLLIVERTMPQSIDGPNTHGQVMDVAVQFQLYTDGADCILVDTRDNSRHVLADTQCATES